MNNIYNNNISDMDLYLMETKRMDCPNCGQRTFTVPITWVLLYGIVINALVM